MRCDSRAGDRREGFKFRFADAHGETFNHDGLIAKRFKREIGQRRAQPILMRAGADIYRNRFAIGEARHEVAQQFRAVIKTAWMQIRLNPNPEWSAAHVEERRDFAVLFKHKPVTEVRRRRLHLLDQTRCDVGIQRLNADRVAALLRAQKSRSGAESGRCELARFQIV